jgi:hypothetical protein
MGQELGPIPGKGLADPEQRYFLDPLLVLEPAVPLIEGAAALVFGFSFFGFLASRLPRCSPLAMSTPPVMAWSVAFPEAA